MRPANSATRAGRASGPFADSFSSICASSRRLDIGLRKSCTIPFASIPENARCSSRRRARSRASSRRATHATSARHSAKAAPTVARPSRYIESTARTAVHSSRSTARRANPASSSNGTPPGTVGSSVAVKVTTCLFSLPSPSASNRRPIRTGPARCTPESPSPPSPDSWKSVSPPCRTATNARSGSVPRSESTSPANAPHPPPRPAAASAAPRASPSASHWPRSATDSAAACRGVRSCQWRNPTSPAAASTAAAATHAAAAQANGTRRTLCCSIQSMRPILSPPPPPASPDCPWNA